MKILMNDPNVYQYLTEYESFIKANSITFRIVTNMCLSGA